MNMFRSAALLLQSVSYDATESPGHTDEMTPVRDALGAAIFAEYIRCSSAKRPVRQPLTDCLLRVRQAINERYAEAWDLERLAEVGGVNPKYLISLFSRHLGETPISFLWRRRAEVELQMLRATPATVEEIAYRCGFQSAAHFSRAMKRRYGHAPTRLRLAPSDSVAHR